MTRKNNRRFGFVECRRSNLGGGYRGTQNETVLGYTCQRWDMQVPHSHTYDDPKYFPDDTLEDAANYCRNPDVHEYGLWCYTTDPDVRWGFCSVPLCGEGTYAVNVTSALCRFTNEWKDIADAKGMRKGHG